MNKTEARLFAQYRFIARQIVALTLAVVFFYVGYQTFTIAFGFAGAVATAFCFYPRCFDLFNEIMDILGSTTTSNEVGLHKLDTFNHDKIESHLVRGRYLS